MTTLVAFFKLSPGELIGVLAVTFAALAYGIRETLDLMGKSPSSRRLRDENVDLIRRNRELEETIDRLGRRVNELEGKTAELERTNQAAVLKAIERHEVNAAARNEKTAAVLERIATSLEARA